MNAIIVQNKIFDFVYGYAMAVAVNQKAYPHIDVNNATPKGKLVCKYPEVKQLVKSFADMVISESFTSSQAYDEAFYILLNDITKALPYFTFGNAHMLVNMTLKYLYIAVYGRQNISAGFKFCHSPVDATVLKKVWKECERLGISVGKKSDFCYSWSVESDDSIEKYKQFQTAVRKIIEYDPNGPCQNGIELNYEMF